MIETLLITGLILFLTYSIVFTWLFVDTVAW